MITRWEKRCNKLRGEDPSFRTQCERLKFCEIQKRKVAERKMDENVK